ncbi:MAG: glycosyltransferase family 2 protein [bacterium]
MTVLMSIYNAEKYVRESIDSILKQTLPDFEFLIINDGSVDRTEEILYTYDDPRIRIINNERNIGLTKSLNKGLQLARGEYIARMDAGDISHQDRLFYQYKFLQENTQFGLVGTSFYRISDSGNIMNKVIAGSDSHQLKNALLKNNCICHGASMFRKDICIKVGGYNERLKFAQDYDLFSKIAMVSKISNLERILYKWRFSFSSLTHRNYLSQYINSIAIARLNKKRFSSFSNEIIEEINDEILTFPFVKRRKILSQRYLTEFKWHMACKEYKKGILCLGYSFLMYPINSNILMLELKYFKNSLFFIVKVFIGIILLFYSMVVLLIEQIATS